MATKKQPDQNVAGTISEDTLFWFRQFVKVFEATFFNAAQKLLSDATIRDYALTAMHAARSTLLDSGLPPDDVAEIYAQVTFESPISSDRIAWNADLNRRRFELIDGDIQGNLKPEEKLELAYLTFCLRAHTNSAENLPIEGAQRLHRQLLRIDPYATDQTP